MFFNPAIPTQNSVQSRCPECYFCHPASRTFSQSLISPRFCFKVPKLELRIREIPDPKKPTGDTLYRRGSPSSNNRTQENNVQTQTRLGNAGWSEFAGHNECGSLTVAIKQTQQTSPYGAQIIIYSRIDRFHSRGQRLCKFLGTKDIFT